MTVLLLFQEEAVPENLKNVLLIMSTNGYLVPPSQNPDREELWNETWKRIDRFLPDLKNSLALEPILREEQRSSKDGISTPAVTDGQAQGQGEEGQVEVEVSEQQHQTQESQPQPKAAENEEKE